LIGKGRARFYGGEGDDYLTGGGESDELFGEAGDDTFECNEGTDVADGGPGSDRLYWGDRFPTDCETLISIP